jgi:hypothetical protein
MESFGVEGAIAPVVLVISWEINNLNSKGGSIAAKEKKIGEE